MIDLGSLPGYGFSAADAINDYGQIVGGVSNPLSGPDGFPTLFYNGAITDLNTLLPQGSGWNLQTAQGINDAGQIVGLGLINGQYHGYILNLNATSVPEPASLGLFGSAAAFIVLLRNKRARG